MGFGGWCNLKSTDKVQKLIHHPLQQAGFFVLLGGGRKEGEMPVSPEATKAPKNLKMFLQKQREERTAKQREEEEEEAARLAKVKQGREQTGPDSPQEQGV